MMVVAGSIAVAQTGPDLLLKQGLKDTSLEVDGSVMFLNQAHAKKADFDLSLSLVDSSGRYRFAPDRPLGPSLGYDFTAMQIDSDAPLLPDQLYDASLAFGMAFAQSGPWWFAASIGGGYAGESFFSDSRAWYAKGDLIFGRELGKGILVGIIDFDGNRSIFPDVPLPGVAYAARFNDTISVVAGLPMSSMTWQPTSDLRLQLDFTIPQDVTISARWQVARHLAILGKLARRLDPYHLDGDSSTRRLFFEQRRVEAGIEWAPTTRLGFQLAAGYAFGQEFLYGFDSRDLDSIVKVSDEPYVRFGVEFRP